MLEIERYTTSLNEVFSTKRKFKYQLLVEKTLAEANYNAGKIPEAAIKIIKKKCTPEHVKLDRAKEIEADIHHDMMAVVLAIAEQCEDYGGYIHLGATSYDIQDTVRALQLKEARKTILDALDELVDVTKRLALKYKDLVCIGRTHGQHAVPTTYGMKFANFLNELLLAKQQLIDAKVAYGKISGAVGTYASYGTKEIETYVLDKLDLKKQDVTTQVVSRVVHARYVMALGLIATVLAHFGREIRNLQRTEINEIGESFISKQVGSSTMPQKKNPEKSERICGLARNIRSGISVALENIILEHERDLTNSSSERILLSESSILTHFIILEMIKVLKSLNFNIENIRHNLYYQDGAQCAEHLMIKLSDKIGRQKAHFLLKRLSKESDFANAVKQNEQIMEYFSDEEIDYILDPMNYVGLASEVVDSFIHKLNRSAKNE